MWIVFVLVAIVVIYLYLIAPRLIHRPDTSSLQGVYYAHRGLHDNSTDAPENSMEAFRKAVDADYGIELDVQLTKDRIPVIFHDETLKRICGVDGRVRDYTFDELQQFHLCNSQEKIPRFQDFLSMVDGRVPLIVEIKIHENAGEVCRRVDQCLKTYKGVYCMESFHPLALKWYRKNRPQVIRGQLSSNFRADGDSEGVPEFLVHHLLLNFLGRPDFIAYKHLHIRAVSRWLCQHLFGALSVAWTVRSQKEIEAARDGFSLFIFEAFVPQPIK